MRKNVFHSITFSNYYNIYVNMKNGHSLSSRITWAWDVVLRKFHALIVINFVKGNWMYDYWRMDGRMHRCIQEGNQNFLFGKFLQFAKVFWEKNPKNSLKILHPPLSKNIWIHPWMVEWMNERMNERLM